jgi:hypothetical protein
MYGFAHLLSQRGHYDVFQALPNTDFDLEVTVCMKYGLRHGFNTFLLLGAEGIAEVSVKSKKSGGFAVVSTTQLHIVIATRISARRSSAA